MTAIPAAYSAIIGPAMNHIVTPLPSGVMAAPNMTMATTAYRMLDRQNRAPTAPEAVAAYIASGSWNDRPNARRNWRTNPTKSITFRKVTRPADSPYLYRNSSTYGTTRTYANAHPAANRPTAGSDRNLPMRASPDARAGRTNAAASLAASGIEAASAASAAMYTWAKNASPGAVCMSETPSGTSARAMTPVIWAAMLLRGSGTG